MKKCYNLLTALGLCISIFSFGQTTSKVTGVAKDKFQKNLEAATVSLLRTKDSSLVKVDMSDKQGRFEFVNIKEGSYLVSITAIGHKKSFSKTFSLNSGDAVNLGDVIMEEESKDLKGIVVTSKKPLIEQRIDRTVVNVEASVTNVGTSALEVLEKSPGITVDRDGNISLKGKQGVIVMIDGRQTYLSAQDLANLLRNMQSNQLEQIEIMTNPPAKYDAAGNAGIINIKTKKNRVMGYNGSVTLGYGQGRYPKFNESVNMNYRTGKFNLFTNVSHNYRKSFNDLTIQRKFIEAGTKELKSHFDQVSRMKDKNQSYNAKLGMDYFASKKTTFGVVFSGFYNPGQFRNHSIIDISDPAYDLQSQTQAFVRNDEKWRNFSTNLNFRHVFDSTGKELTADIDYIGYNASNNQNLINTYFDALGNPMLVPDTLLGDLPQDIKIYSGKIDYVHPLKKGAKLEAGIKTSFVRTDNNARYDSVLNGELVIDRGRSNHFIYDENINAAYVNISKQFSKKFSGQFGLRLEHTHAKGNQVTTGEKFERNYAQLFPTMFLQYSASEKNVFGLNYGRRIRRPDYESLNPFVMFLDRYTYEQGNPNLKPQFSHNVELSHTFMSFLTTTLNYTKTTDIIQQVLEQNTDENQTFVKQANIAKQRQYGVSVSAMTKFAKWWTGNIYANVYNNRFDGIVNNDFVSIGATTLVLNASQQFKFNKGWSAELSGFYRTEGVEGVFRIRPFGMMTIGASKQVLKTKGTVRVTVRDVLWTQKIKGESRFSNIDAAFQNQRDSRVANVSFTYRFSKGKVNGGNKRRTGGAGDEQNRVKVGGEN
jgi:iron complex outermembrane recepter protein